MTTSLDSIDRAIVNRLQDGLPATLTPYATAAHDLGIGEEELLNRLTRLRTTGVLSRLGPMYNAPRFGGGLSLCAMAVPAERFEEVAQIVNGFPEVAHNYAREHRFNMWFVLATEDEATIAATIARIEGLTDIKVLNLPKLEEYFIGLRVSA
jgi:DNA-binding Lrp family transcriptional regulator